MKSAMYLLVLLGAAMTAEGMMMKDCADYDNQMKCNKKKTCMWVDGTCEDIVDVPCTEITNKRKCKKSSVCTYSMGGGCEDLSCADDFWKSRKCNKNENCYWNGEEEACDDIDVGECADLTSKRDCKSKKYKDWGCKFEGGECIAATSSPTVTLVCSEAYGSRMKCNKNDECYWVGGECASIDDFTCGSLTKKMDCKSMRYKSYGCTWNMSTKVCEEK